MCKIAIFLALALTVVLCEEEYLVTRAYTDYLKRHVSWEVVDYEDNLFRGFTMAEAAMFLGNKPPMNEAPYPAYQPSEETLASLPSSFDWRERNPKCVHQVRNQGSCGSCWSFATSGMLADRCCIMSKDHGLLAYPPLC